MKRFALLGVIIFAFTSIAADSSSVASASDRRSVTYKVTVTNITRGSGADSGQILNGLTVLTHNRKVRLFSLGEPAREDLALLAEDAANADLVSNMSANPNVCDVQTIDGVILPGDSAEVLVTVSGGCHYLTLAAMMVTTNDAFIALNSVPLWWQNEHLALAYDAGSEANTENCDDIPGPPCGNVNRVGGGEGYVSIHSGIHGTAGGVATSDLNPADRDWRNPAAYITVERMRR